MVDKRTTILDEVARNQELLAAVLKGAGNPHEQYLARLILDSHALASRRSAEWEFKSLLEYGEEDFAKGGSFRVLYGVGGDDVRMWHRQAAKSLGNEVTRSVLYEHDEGLVLFVRENGSHRPARPGDGAYDFVKRLYADEILSDIAVDGPVSWAQELFLNRSNLEAYACLWYDLDYLSKPGREELKRARREAVWRETLRLFGREPYASSKVPEPGTWSEVGGEKESPTPPQKSEEGAQEGSAAISTRERNTLLCVIGALCHEAKIDFTKAAKAAGLIQGAAAQIGVSLGETTIEGHLKKVRDAIASRSSIGRS